MEVSIEQQAQMMGHIPQDQWTGPPDKWVDAQTFVQRAEEKGALAVATNHKLMGKVAALESQLQNQTQMMQSFREHTLQMAQDMIKRQRDELEARLVAAREDGNVRQELAVQKDLQALERREASLETAVPAAQPPEAPAITAWKEANPWYMTDPDKRAVADGIILQIVKDAQAKGLPLDPATALAQVDQRMARILAKEPAPMAASKAEGGARPASVPVGTATQKGYAALPPDAKAQCDKDGRAFIGEGKLFKTAAEWQDHYCRLYFAATGGTQ